MVDELADYSVAHWASSTVELSEFSSASVLVGGKVVLLDDGMAVN